MPDYSAIIAAIKEMNDAHKECVESLKEEIRTGLRMSAVQIDSEMEIVNSRIKGLSDHVSAQNGNVAKLTKESEDRKQAVIDFRVLEGKHKKRDKWIRRNIIWIILGFVLFVSVVVIAVEIIGAKVVIEKAIDKITVL